MVTAKEEGDGVARSSGGCEGAMSGGDKDVICIFSSRSATDKKYVLVHRANSSPMLMTKVSGIQVASIPGTQYCHDQTKSDPQSPFLFWTWSPGTSPWHKIVKHSKSVCA